MMQAANPSVHLTMVETSSSGALSLAVRHAFDMAIEGRSQLMEPLFKVQGFSGRKFRMFLNNLFATLQDRRYLEIGVFMGGSLVPALYRNGMRATAVDNWSWPGANMGVLKNYITEFAGDCDVTIVNSNFRSVDFAELGPFNVMFYDGSHAELDQRDGVRLPVVSMDANYVVIVDDWNWDHVRRGTFAGLRDAGCRIDSMIELRTTLQNEGQSLPEVFGSNSDWHNGMFAAVVTRL